MKVRPYISGGITHASTFIATPYETAKSSWHLSTEGDVVYLEVTVLSGIKVFVEQDSGVCTEAKPEVHSFWWKLV
jgi:hypothetical protein